MLKVRPHIERNYLIFRIRFYLSVVLNNVYLRSWFLRLLAVSNLSIAVSDGGLDLIIDQDQFPCVFANLFSFFW